MATPAAGLQNRPEPVLLQRVKGERMAGGAVRESGLSIRAGTTTDAV
ncbi:hypothetical protein PQR67_09685 [Paraburkholderia fungorum]